jgi:Family of unknown function (DUF6335)
MAPNAIEPSRSMIDDSAERRLRQRDTEPDLTVSVWIGIPDREMLRTNEILEHRDIDRWELDPQSAEDFEK